MQGSAMCAGDTRAAFWVLMKGDTHCFQTTLLLGFDKFPCLHAFLLQNDSEDKDVEAQNGMTQGDKLNALKSRRQPCSATTGALR